MSWEKILFFLKISHQIHCPWWMVFLPDIVIVSILLILLIVYAAYTIYQDHKLKKRMKG